MPYVESENSINMVNASNGRLYTYAYIGNNGEMQAAKLYQISYDKEGGADASDINIIDNGKIFLYQDNLAQEETEAAETENTISKRKFSSIFKKLVPAQFKEINQDNLDKYLVEDYEETDMYEIPDDVNQAIETYWKSLQDRKNAFDNSTVTLPRSSAEVLSDADNAGKTIYFAEDGLSCYPEERVEWSYTDDREAAIYAYMDMLSEYTDDEYDRYALIYIDEDDVPELIMDKKDNFFVICTYKDGEIYAGEDMNYNFYSRYYSYYENENIIQIYYTNGTDWGEEFYHLANGAGMECFMTVNARASKTSSGAVRVDSQASPLQNYYVDGTNVSHEEFYNKIADVSEKQPINMMNMHYNSREEMLEILTDEL
jgi:predicted HNH restriction endonuclease